jgi:hypothetical protein
MAMGRNMAIADPRRAGKERRAHAPRHLWLALFVDDGDKVKRGQRLAEWDPYTRPILTEVEGPRQFEDWSTASPCGNDRRIDRHHQARRSSTGGRRPRYRTCKPAIVLTAGRQDRKLARGGDARFMLSVDGDPLGRAGREGEARVTCWRVSRWKAPRPRTSPAVCRALPNCSRHVVRRITPSSPRSMVRSASGATTRTSVASSSSRMTAPSRSST